MRSNETRLWALTLSGAGATASTLAHPTRVGFLAVQGVTTGGLRFARPRNNQINVKIQPSMGAYGISGSAAQVSLMVDASAPATAKASGVPPRGRPV